MQHKGWSKGIIAVVAILAAGLAQAATRTWSGAGADNNWTTAANWGGTAPVAGDDLVFPDSAARKATNTNDFAAGTNFNSITFGNTGPAYAGGYTLSGNAINLGAGGITAYDNAANVMSLGGITLTANQNWLSQYDSFGGSKRLTVNSTVNLQGFTLSLNGSGILDLSGAISGTGGLGSSGGGIIFLVGATPHTYTGPTNVGSGNFVLAGTSLSPSSVITVSGGLFQMDNSASVGALTINSGGTLCLCGGGINQHGSATSLTMNSGSSFFPTFYSLTNYGQLTVSGSVTLNSPTLVLGWSAYTSTAGNTFLIINKTGAGAITGTFNTQPEGSALTSNGRRYTVSYVAGDGNDAVLTDAPAAPPVVGAIPTLSSAGLAALSLLLLGAFALRSRFASAKR